MEKSAWKNMKVVKSLFYEQEENLKGKLVADIVGYMFQEISRVAWFFIERRGKNKWKGFCREI